MASNWIDASDKRVRTDSDDLSKWWTVFNDPVLNDLICDAYHQNLTLREAGYRVLQARAQLGIAIGEIFPQTQAMTGDFLRQASSGATGSTQRISSRWDYGFTLAWELDFWGKFRRAVESNRANLQASVADYDDVLVTLLGDVATAYVQYRTAEERIKYATQNADIQAQVLEITKVKAGPKSAVPRKWMWIRPKAPCTRRRPASPRWRSRCGLPTTNSVSCSAFPRMQLQARLGKAPIPVAPVDVAVGIPADLLRRRPDVREAERLAAAQCAQIGVAVSAYYPHISILGTIDWQANRFKDLFNGKAFSGSVGPSFEWDILQYGRLLNNVRLQEASYLDLVEAYRQAVLNADQEVETGLVTFLKSQEQYNLQKKSVDSGKGALDTVREQWKAGVVDFTRVAQLLQNQTVLEDTLAQVQGEIATGLISIYVALGGGWELRLNGCRNFPRRGGTGAASPADASPAVACPADACPGVACPATASGRPGRRGGRYAPPSSSCQ